MPSLEGKATAGQLVECCRDVAEGPWPVEKLARRIEAKLGAGWTS